MVFRFFVLIMAFLPHTLMAQDEWSTWAIKVDGDKLFEVLTISEEAVELLPFRPEQIQFSIVQTGDNSFIPSISIIAIEDMEPMVAKVLAQVNAVLPDMGCRDFIAVEHIGIPGTQDRRINAASMLYPFRIFGAERACDWPHGTYAKYSGPINLLLSLEQDGTLLQIVPSVEIGEIQVSWKDYGKIGREIFRIADDAVDFFGGDLGFENLMKEIQDASNLDQYRKLTQSLLDDYTAEIDLKEIIPQDLINQVTWSSDTKFFREVRLSSQCGFGASGPIVKISTKAKYMLNVELELATAMSRVQAQVFSAFVKRFAQGVSNGEGSFIQPSDTRIEPSYNLSPSECN